MERIAVCTVVTEDLKTFQKSLTSLRKNAGLKFEHWIVDNSQDEEIAEYLAGQAHEYDEVYLMQMDKRASFSICMNLLLDKLTQDPPDYLVLLDSDIMLASRRVLKKLRRFIKLAEDEDDRVVVQPKIERGLQRAPRATGEVPDVGPFSVLDIPDVRCLMMPFYVTEAFRFDHFAPLIFLDGHRLGLHINKILGIAIIRLDSIRAKHLGQTHRLRGRKYDGTSDSKLSFRDQVRGYVSYGLGA